LQEEEEILYLKDWNFEKEFAEYGLYEAKKKPPQTKYSLLFIVTFYSKSSRTLT